MGNSIKTVIFDIDNTLYDFTDANRQALKEVEEYSGRHFGWSAEEFYGRYNQVQDEVISELGYNGSCRNRILRFQKLMEKYSLPLTPHVTGMYDLYWNTLLSVITPFPYAEETIRTLKERGLRIGAGTDMTAYMQFRKLDAMNLLQYFDFIVSSEEAGGEKPGEAFFTLCVRKAGCHARECLFIGDSLEKDYRGALLAGMHALWYNWKKKDSEGPVEQISSLEQIIQIAGRL